MVTHTPIKKKQEKKKKKDKPTTKATIYPDKFAHK